MIRHHPDDALMLELAAGRLRAGPAMLVRVHIEHCVRCKGRLLGFEALGGSLLERTEPVALDLNALSRTMARLTGPPKPAHSRRLSTPALEIGTLAGVKWPHSMRGCTATKWRWIGPGRSWSRVTLPDDATANVFFLRIEAGRKLPVHSHLGGELTQVLHGAFRDGDEQFAVGDFDEADGNVHHRPVAEPGDPCICLATVEGRLAFDGPMARLWGAVVGI